MATAVQIELIVDEKGAVQGVRTLNTAMQGATSQVAQLDAGLKRLNADLAQVGTQGAAGMRKVSDEAHEMGGHFQTSFDTVRLLRTELGVRVPRAMESIIARNKEIMTALTAMRGLMVGVGAGFIAFSFGKEAIDGVQALWHNMLDVNAATKEYQAEVKKTQQEDFGNPHSIETTKVRIQEAQAALRAYQAEKQRILAGGESRNMLSAALGPLEIVHQRWWANNVDENVVQQQRMLDKLQLQRAPEQEHSQNLDQIKTEHLYDFKLSKEKQITAEKQKQHEIDAEDARYAYSQDVSLGNPGSYAGLNGRAGSLMAYIHGDPNKDAAAKAEAAKDLFELQKERANQLRHLQDEAAESRLSGIALINARERAAVADLRANETASAQAVAAVHQRFDSERLKALKDQQREVEKLRDETMESSLTGVAKIRYRTEASVRGIWANGGDLATNYHKEQYTRQQGASQQLEAEQQFTDRVNDMAEQRAERTVTGFARIRLEAQRQIDELQREFEKQYGKDPNAPDYKAHAGELNRGVGVINADAADQGAELARRAADETAQIEAEARAHSLAAAKNQTRAFEAEYEARTEKWHEQLADQEIGEDDYNRRSIAAAQLRDAQIAESAQAARDRMAGEFSGFFKSLDHPTQALAGLGANVGGKVAAALLQRVSGGFGGDAGGEHGRGHGLPGMDNMMDSVLDRIAGRHKGIEPGPQLAPGMKAPLWKGKPLPGAEAINKEGGPAVAMGGEHSFSVAQATIRVGSASIVMSGGSTAPGAFSRGGGASSFSSGGGFSGGGAGFGDDDLAQLAGSRGPNAGGGWSASTGRGSYTGGEVPGGTGISAMVDSAASSSGRALGAGFGDDDLAQLAGSRGPNAGGGWSASTGRGSYTGGEVPGGTGISAMVDSAASSSGRALGAGFGDDDLAQLAGSRGPNAGGGWSASTGRGSYTGGEVPGGTGISAMMDSAASSSGRAPGAGAGGDLSGHHNSVAGIGGELEKSMSLFGQGKSIFGGAGGSGANATADTQNAQVSGSFDKDGNFTAGEDGNGGMLGGGGVGANLAGAAGGAMGLYSAYQGNGGIGGGLSGAMSGMGLGMALGGPAGAAIGAAGGAIMGAIGFGGREKARVWWLKNGRPRLTSDTMSFQEGAMDYLSAYTDVENLKADANRTTNSMGPAAKGYYQDDIKAEIAKAESNLSREAKAGRANYGIAAASYDVGSDSIPSTGLNLNHEGERIVPSDQNERITRALESGADTSLARVTASYRSAMQGGGAGRTVHHNYGDMHINAIDSRSGTQFLMDNKHVVRSAMNASYAENSGGADA